MTTPTTLTIRARRELRGAIESDIARLDETIASLTRSFDDIVAAQSLVNTDDEHDPEGTTIAFERAQVSALLAQSELDRDDLRRTFVRVGEPGYGVCETCGGFIGAERLLALPATLRCVRCAI